jgi:hypothetical protein
VPKWPVLCRAAPCLTGGAMPNYKVTGGQDGEAGIEIDGTRYEPGETLTAPSKKVDWLVEQGYLEAAGTSKAVKAEES